MDSNWEVLKNQLRRLAERRKLDENCLDERMGVLEDLIEMGMRTADYADLDFSGNILLLWFMERSVIEVVIHDGDTIMISLYSVLQQDEDPENVMIHVPGYQNESDLIISLDELRQNPLKVLLPEDSDIERILEYLPESSEEENILTDDIEEFEIDGKNLEEV